MALSTVLAAGSLLDVNVGLAAALGLMIPLGAQIDFLLQLGLGPLEFDLALQFSAAISAQATLSLQISDPTIALQLAISAVAQLQAALQAALTLPTISLTLTAELNAAASLAASLSAKLGGIKLLIEASLAIKIPAMRLAAELNAALAVGGTVFLQYFTGATLAQTGTDIQNTFAVGLNQGGYAIAPADDVVGVLITAGYNASIQASFKLLFGIP